MTSDTRKSLDELFNLPLVKCHHKDAYCKLAYIEPNTTHFPDGRVMDHWKTRCIFKQEFASCESYRFPDEEIIDDEAV